MNELYCLLLMIAQRDTVPGAETKDAAADPAAASGGMFGGMLTFLPMMLLLVFVWLMIMQKPQQKDQQRLQKLLADLKKNDRVVTAGGILGHVVNVSSDSEFVTIRIDEATNTKLQVLKQSIVRVLKEAETAKENTAKASS